MVTEEKSGEHQSQEPLLCGNNTSEISSVCRVGLTDWKQKWITFFQFESVPVQPLAVKLGTSMNSINLIF